MVKWMLVMVTINGGVPSADHIDIFDSIAECYVGKTKQEFEYDFKTLKRDWVCVRIEGQWDYALRY